MGIRRQSVLITERSDGSLNEWKQIYDYSLLTIRTYRARQDATTNCHQRQQLELLCISGLAGDGGGLFEGI